MNAIADASSLIVLARQNALWLLERTFGAVGLVPEVEFETVIQGKAKGYADARRIEAAIAAQRLVVISPTSNERQVAIVIKQNAPNLSRAAEWLSVYKTGTRMTSGNSSRLRS